MQIFCNLGELSDAESKELMKWIQENLGTNKVHEIKVGKRDRFFVYRSGFSVRKFYEMDDFRFVRLREN